MFLKLELWEEEPREDNRAINVGSSIDCWLDMKAMKATVLPVNAYAIISFEHIRINTIGRPGTKDNKLDCLTGVRIRLADGTQHVVIDKNDACFEDFIRQAKATDEAVLDVGRSPYMDQFAPLKSVGQ